MTPAERVVWELVRGNRLGYHFRRQQVIDGYIADFYCHAAALVVEVDGPIHDEQVEYDQRRTVVFEVRGICVLRFQNEEVVTNAHGVAERIRAECGKNLSPQPPLPEGEGEPDPPR